MWRTPTRRATSTRASVRSRSSTAGQSGVSVDTTGINRNLNTLLQSQLWTETSGGSYADTTSQLYQQLQQIYGTPGSSSSFSGIYSNFTTALQALSTSPSSYSAQTQVIGAAQALTQNLNAMTGTIQQLRTQAEQGIATDVQTANTAIAQIAQINQQLGAAPPDSTTATLEDQRDQDITQLAPADECQRGAGRQQSDLGLHGERPAARVRRQRRRRFHSATSER